MTGISDANISSESTRGKGDDKISSAASHTDSTDQLTINIYLIIMKMILNRVVSHHFSQLEKMSYNLKKKAVY